MRSSSPPSSSPPKPLKLLGRMPSSNRRSKFNAVRGSSGDGPTRFLGLAFAFFIATFIVVTACAGMAKQTTHHHRMMVGGRTVTSFSAASSSLSLRQIADDIRVVRKLVASTQDDLNPSSTTYTVVDRRIDGKPLYLFKACPDPAIVPTSEWSCIRRVSPEELARRDPNVYGFQESDWATHPQKNTSAKAIGVRNPRDVSYDAQIPHQVHLTGGPGYGLMDMPAGMHAILSGFLTRHMDAERVEGDSTQFDNGHVHPTTFVDIDCRTCKEGYNNATEVLVGRIVQGVLEEWTHQALETTVLYGIRIYPKNAVLINHVDVRETHVASAILQVAQQTDVGWPLELIEPDGSVIEVYMQPGQMLLYEGSRVPHGRPRRFEGDSFANIFAHYKPKDWTYDAELSKELDEKAYQVQQQGQTQ